MFLDGFSINNFNAINIVSGLGIFLVIVIWVFLLMVYVLDFEWSEACITGFCIGVFLAAIIIVESHGTLWIFK